MRIETRPAQAEDAAFLAWVMQEAARSHLEKGVWDLMFPGEDGTSLEILEKILTTERVHFGDFSRFAMRGVYCWKPHPQHSVKPTRYGSSARRTRRNSVYQTQQTPLVRPMRTSAARTDETPLAAVESGT